MWYSSGSCDNLVLIENNELISASFAPATLTKESIMPPIRNDWAKVLAPEYNKPYYRKLFDFVGKEYSTHIYIAITNACGYIFSICQSIGATPCLCKNSFA